MKTFKQMQGRTEPISDEALAELMELSKQIIKYMWDNGMFHAAVGITTNGVRIAEDVFCSAFEDDDIAALGVSGN
jgi:hypothetical protein